MKRKEFVDVQAEGGDDEEKKETAERGNDDYRLFSLGNTDENGTYNGAIVLPPFVGFVEEVVSNQAGENDEGEDLLPIAIGPDIEVEGREVATCDVAAAVIQVCKVAVF